MNHKDSQTHDKPINQEDVKRIAISLEPGLLNIIEEFSIKHKISKSELIAKSLKLYQFMLVEQEEGAKIIVEDAVNGKMLVKIL